MKLSSGIPNAPELLSCGALTRGRMKVTLYKECYRKEIVLFSQYIYLFHAKESLLFSESVVPVADFCMMNLTVNTFIKEKTGESGRF